MATFHAYSYDDSVCVAATSLTDACNWFAHNLPCELDPALVHQLDDSELDHHGHWFTVPLPGLEGEEEERSHSFRTELTVLSQSGDTAPQALYDRTTGPPM